MIPVFFCMKKYGRRLLVWVCALLVGTLSAVAQQSDEQLAAYYYDRGDFAQASELYETLYQRGSNKYHYQRLLDTYLRLSQYKDATRLVEQRQKKCPGELALLVDEGQVYLAQKQEKKAIKCFNRAVERVGNDLQPVPELAEAFRRLGRYDYAIRTYKKAREQTHNEMLYFNELVTVYQLAGDYQAMTDEYFNLLDRQPGMMQSLQATMQKNLQEAPDTRLAEGIRGALIDRVRAHPESHVYLEMMIWFALQQQDFQFALDQAVAVDSRFPDAGGDHLLRVARIAQSNAAYDVAAEGYRLLQRKGKDDSHYFDARVGELEVEYLRLGNQYLLDAKSLAMLRAKYQAAFDELGKNARTVPLLRHYASLMAYHGGDVQEAVDALDDVLEINRITPRVRDEVKLELGDLLLFAGQTWDASLLYMQVEKANPNDVLGASAKFRNARLSYYSHDFQWAKSQLDVLRASTSKLIANDAMELSLLLSDNMDDDSTYTTLALFADADLLLYQGKLDEAWAGFDATAASMLSHPLHDEVLMRKALIRSRQGRYADADSLLKRVADLYPDDITADDALMQRAELNEQQLGHPDVALQCYEKLLLDYPTSLYVEQARKRYNQLKKP